MTRALVVGLGSIGRRHARNWAALGLGPVSVVRQARRSPEPLGIEAREFVAIDDALNEQPDVVLVTNPTSLHLDVACQAIRAGAHVLVEKPLAHHLDGVADLLREARQAQRHVMVGYNLRFHPGLARLHELVRQNAIGRLVSVRAEAGEYLPDWHPWEDYRQGYSARRDLGGGAVLTFSHELDAVCWLLGAPQRLVALAAHASALEIDTEDVADIVLQFAAGVQATVHVDYLRRPPKRSIELVGEDGVLRWEYNENRVLRYAPDTRQWRVEVGDPGLDRNDMYLAELAHFGACARGEIERPLVDGQQGAAILAIALASLRSSETGRAIDFRAEGGAGHDVAEQSEQLEPRPFPDLFRLDGRVALVTGGAGLLGRRYCEALLQAGAQVVVGDLDGVRAQGLAAELGNNALGLQQDVSDEDSVRHTVDHAVSHFGRLDILVNNAALTVRGGSERLSPADYFAPFEEYKRSVWDQALAVNLTGMVLCAQAAGRQMLRQDRPGGVLVNISSTYGVVAPDQRLYEGVTSPYANAGFNTPVSYAVTKTAVLGLTRYLATYWAGKNIRVNALTPHGVFDNHDDSFVRNFVYRSPLGRMARNDEYRGALLFLVSDASSYMTGTNLIVDGGWTAW